ncbi:retrovirus-related pol polyprotein from transposon TNT 1-94 [Tanacetum coccineum]
MADVNVDAPAEQAPAMAPPARTDEQILPRISWVLIGKSNCYLDMERSQSNLIYKISVDILMFTKLIIFHLQCKHKFHPRPKSPLHLPTKESVLGYLKFSAKGTKQEVFRMSIPNELITDDIRCVQYYNAYLEKVAKHQRYLAGEEVRATLKPKPVPAKHKEKKRKLVTETSKAPSLAKRSKADMVAKKRTKKSSPRLVDEFVDEGVPENEPRIGDEEADLQKALEESLKDVHSVRQGPLPPVVIREPESGKFQPLPEVPGKGKDKVGEEQAAQVLLNLQTPKKKSPAKQYIFQRRTPAPTEHSGHEESSSLYAKLGLSDSDTESDEEMPPVVTSGAQDEGQAGLNPGDDAAPQPQSTPVVHAGPNLEHTDVEATDASNRPHPEQMDEGFISTAYFKVQENLKLTVEEPVIPEEPASSTGTLSSLQHLAKDFSFGDQFFNDKPSEADNEKTTANTEAESMVSVTIHQDTSAIPLMTSPVIDVTSRSDSPNIHRPLPTTATVTATTTMTTTTYPLPPQPQQSATDSILIKRIDIPHQVSKAVDEIITNVVNWALQSPLMDRFRDLPEADMKEILYHRMWESNSYQAQEDYKKLYEALEKSKKKRQDSPKTPPGSPPHQPPPPPPPAGQSRALETSRASGSSQVPSPPPPPSTNQGVQSTSIAAPNSSKTATLAEYTAWTMTNTRIKPSVSSTLEELHMDDDTTADEQAYLSSDRPATPEPAWSIPSSDLTVPKNNWAFALTSTYAPPPENSLLAQTGDMATFMDWYNVSKPLPLGGEPGHVTIQPDFFFNKDLEYLRYGRKIGRPALSISKMKATYYPDVALEQMVPDQMWIEEECKYDIAAMYGISHWWFQRQRFYIDRHTSEGDRRAVRTHMKILSVVRIKVFSLYGYDYMKKIILRRADLKEYIITERDFKYLYPSDFEDLYLLDL